jgi:hypothetical protein
MSQLKLNPNAAVQHTIPLVKKYTSVKQCHTGVASSKGTTNMLPCAHCLMLVQSEHTSKFADNRHAASSAPQEACTAVRNVYTCEVCQA